MNTETFARLFPLGSHLCRQPMPAMTELKRDMEILRNQGFNLIKLQEHWAYDEPEEECCDFSVYEELIDFAARLDLGVYVGLTCEQAPPWLWRKHPGARMVRRDGLPLAYEAQMTLPADGKPGPCFDHPGAMADHLRSIRKLVETLGRFENVVVWNTWQEIGYWGERFAGGHVCYNEETLAHFRRWLESRYGDLDSLNRAWRTRYANWESVAPDRSGRPAEALPQDIAWRTFMDNVHVAHVLRCRARTIREADPLGRPVFAHKAGPVIGSGMDWSYARCQDFLGSSAYPAWFPVHSWDDAHPAQGQPFDRREALLAEAWDAVAMRFDVFRSANGAGKPVWAAEFQGGPVSTNFHLGRVPSGADLRRWMLTSLASGVTGICFWVTRAEIAAAEMNGFSLLDSEGQTTERLEEAARLGRFLQQHAELFGRPTWEQAPVALFVDENNYQFCESLVPGGEHLAYSVRGWHRLLWDLGIPVDFLETSQLEEEFVRRYRALVVPFPLSLSECVAQKLVAYVESGGCLISEAAPGRVDENGYANRGELSPVLRQLFGVRQAGFQLVREPEGSRVRWTPQERTWGEFLDATILEGAGPLAGHTLRANVVLQTFECQGSEPVLKSPADSGRAAGKVAGVRRAYARGHAWLLGSYIGHNGTAHRDPAVLACVEAILGAAGVTPQRMGGLPVRRRVLPHKEAWFFTNPTDHMIQTWVSVEGWSRAAALAGSPLERRGHEVLVSVPSLDVTVVIVER